ncbi:Isopentenyl phosphate kinase [uncultured archaeon]|nr:Isopentenyl phosphate kinase [uncultured archaeon]
MEELLILKIGGSVITDKFSEMPSVNDKNLDSVSGEIALAYKKHMPLIIVHGAGSYGHVIVKRTGIDRGIETDDQLAEFAETQRLQNELNCIVTKRFIEKGIPAMPCQPSASAVMASGKLLHMDTSAIEGLIRIGMVPVLYGVPAYDETQKCSILSGDEIAPYLATNLKAGKIIHATNVDGVFTSDPNIDPDARLIPEINSENIKEVKNWLAGSTATDVTGGMFRKVSELLDIGIESQIVNALTPGNVSKAILGKEVTCTIIRAMSKPK